MRAACLLLPGLLLLAALVLPACGWDDDTEYHPKAGETFLLFGQSHGTGHILRLPTSGDNGLLQANWHSTLGLQGAAAMAADGEKLWVCSPTALANWDTEEAEAEGIWPLRHPASALAVGRYHVLVASAADSLLLFLDKEQPLVERFRLALPGPIGPVLYHDEQFHIAFADSLLVVDDRSLGQPARLGLPGLILHMQLDPSFQVELSLADAQRASFRTATNTLLNLRSRPHDAIRFTPYADQSYGVEWTANLSLSEGLLRGGSLSLEPVRSFEADFFFARLFYTQGDSLLVQDLRSNETLLRRGVAPGDTLIQGLTFHPELN